MHRQILATSRCNHTVNIKVVFRAISAQNKRAVRHHNCVSFRFSCIRYTPVAGRILNRQCNPFALNRKNARPVRRTRNRLAGKIEGRRLVNRNAFRNLDILQQFDRLALRVGKRCFESLVLFVANRGDVVNLARYRVDTRPRDVVDGALPLESDGHHLIHIVRRGIQAREERIGDIFRERIRVALRLGRDQVSSINCNFKESARRSTIRI